MSFGNYRLGTHLRALMKRGKQANQQQPSPAKAAAGPSSRAVRAEDEKKRVATILCSPEAKGRKQLAEHLALKSNLSAEAAIECMRHAGRDLTAGPYALDEEVAADNDREAEQLAKHIVSVGAVCSRH